jgi:hypothetical protein
MLMWHLQAFTAAMEHWRKRKGIFRNIWWVVSPWSHAIVRRFCRGCASEHITVPHKGVSHCQSGRAEVNTGWQSVACRYLQQSAGQGMDVSVCINADSSVTEHHIHCYHLM